MKWNQLVRLPAPSYGCQSASISGDGVGLKIAYEFIDGADRKAGGVLFRHVAAFRYTGEIFEGIIAPQCSESVAECLESRWLRELAEAEPEDSNHWPFARRHFGLYLQNVGCYEIIAESVEYLEPRSVPNP